MAEFQMLGVTNSPDMVMIRQNVSSIAVLNKLKLAVKGELRSLLFQSQHLQIFWKEI